MKKACCIFILLLITGNLIYSQGKYVPVTGNTSQLEPFFKSLSECKDKKIRIAHYGDSIIEGDVITSDLRLNLQKKFGGEGVGFVSICPGDALYRKSVNVTFSDNWKEASIFKLNPEKYPLGINGAVYIPENNSWIKTETSLYTKPIKYFKSARLYFINRNEKCSLGVNINETGNSNYTLNKGENLQEFNIPIDVPAKNIKLNFNNCRDSFIYGLCLENGNGIYVDNLPIKGNSGVSLVDINSNVLKAFNSFLNYKLIILNFGVNVLSREFADYKWYQKKLEKVIKHFQEAFPNAGILVVSVGDKGVKKNTRFVSDPLIPSLIKAQRDAAANTGTAFWNLFEAMGGKDAVNNWVNAGPPLMFKDYTHLTYEGGKKAADLLTDAILKEYEKYYKALQ